jgi:hypothetical protein
LSVAQTTVFVLNAINDTAIRSKSVGVRIDGDQVIIIESTGTSEPTPTATATPIP